MKTKKASISPRKPKYYIKRTVILLLILFGVYAAADQILFQVQKAQYVAAAEQYAQDKEALNNIPPKIWAKGTDQIVAYQKKRMDAFYKKYPSKHSIEDVNYYLQYLKTGLRSGSRWEEYKVQELELVSAWKSPLESCANIRISYAVHVPCDVGKPVLLMESGMLAGRNSGEGKHIETAYCKVDYRVTAGKWVPVQNQSFCIENAGGGSSNVKEDKAPPKDKHPLAP